MAWSTTEVDNECHDQETNNSDDLDTSKHEFGLAIDLNGEDIKADHKDDYDGNPYCNTDVLCSFPVIDNDRSGRNFGAERDGRSIPVLLRWD